MNEGGHRDSEGYKHQECSYRCSSSKTNEELRAQWDDNTLKHPESVENSVSQLQHSELMIVQFKLHVCRPRGRKQSSVMISHFPFHSHIGYSLTDYSGIVWVEKYACKFMKRALPGYKYDK